MCSALTIEKAYGLLLQSWGSEVGNGALLDSIGHNPGLDEILYDLDRRGVLARWVAIESSDLEYVDSPTIICKDISNCWIFHGKRGKFWIIEGSDGEITETDRFHDGSVSVLQMVQRLPEGSLWQRLIKLSKPYKKSFLMVIAASLCMQVLALLTPKLTQLLIDRVFAQGAPSLFLVLIYSMVLIAGYQAWMNWIEARTLLYIELRLGIEVRQGFFAHILRLPFSFLASKDVGELSQGFYGLAQAKTFLTGDVVATAMRGVFALTYVAAMASVYPLGAILLLFAGLTYFIGTVVVGRMVFKQQAEVVQLQAKERSFLVEMLAGLPIIKASGAESRMEQEWGRRFVRRRMGELDVERQKLIGQSLVNNIYMAVVMGVTLSAGYQALGGSLSIGQMLSFTMMATAFGGSLQSLGGTYLNWLMLKPILQQTQEALDQQPLPVPPRPDLGSHPGPIMIRDLWFRYREDGPWVLQGVNLDIEPGQKFLIRGASGCGKSTLLKLLAGLYPPTQGSITFSGSAPGGRSGQVAYLPQFVRPFGGTILENMRLLSGGTSRERLMEAAHQTGLDELVRSFPMGYETLLSSGGNNLSGGQRQLIALTALLASPKQVILMDEAMANLDSIWKVRLFRCPMFANKTVVFVSHDDGTGLWEREFDAFQQVTFSPDSPYMAIEAR